jgi:hypothetical protein
MDIAASMRALRRRWLLTSFLFLLTLVAAVGVWIKLPGPYQAESMVVIIPSQQSSTLNGNNPYLSFGGSEQIAGDVVLREVAAPPQAAALAAQGDTASYSIVDDPTTAGPILDITVTGSSQAVVENTLHGVTTAVQKELATLQSNMNLKPASKMTSQVVSFDPVPKLETTKKARSLIVVLVLGLVLTYAIPQMVDGEISRRRSARDQRVAGRFASGVQQMTPQHDAGSASYPVAEPAPPGPPRSAPFAPPRAGAEEPSARPRSPAGHPSNRSASSQQPDDDSPTVSTERRFGASWSSDDGPDQPAGPSAARPSRHSEGTRI